MPLTRRRLLKAGFWSGAALAATGGIASFLRMLYPGTEDLSVFTVNPDDVPEPGGVPFQHNEGRFFLVNLRPGEGGREIDLPGPGGLLAVSWRCPHLTCAVRHPDRAEYAGGGGTRKGFGCPCHGSRFTTAGVRTSGPASRSLDTATCTVTPHGHVQVNMQAIRNGDYDNPQRAIPYTPERLTSPRAGRLTRS